ncbi:MAG: histidinol-phosphatase HisJ family protein [Ruminococcaceae bacterium]|nr:histidinol-phosphatase HisJ family protein [Oscillospiraceae bacterium]
MITDGHNHTKHFSPDAGQTIDELIAEARSKGFTRIGITEHYEVDYPDDGLDWTFDFAEYDKLFPSWREKAAKSGLDLLMGVEFGYQTHVAKEIDRLASQIPFDVVLLSVHLFRGKDFYVDRECYKLPAKELHSEYIGIMAEMCEKCDNYDVAAHYDYINRYADNKSDFVTYDECPKEFDRLFEAIISKGKALEINTKSIRKHIDGGFTRQMPDPAILNRYRDMGGKQICLGSDSHYPGTFGVCFDEAVQYLKSLGFTESVYFKAHKPVFEPL